MSADLSQSVYDSLQRGLRRARDLADGGQSRTAAEVYRRCAQLARRYAGYAVTEPERNRRFQQADAFEAKAAELSRKPDGVPGSKHPRHGKVGTEGGTVNEERYREAALSYLQRATVTWDEIAGLDGVKDDIRLAYGMAVASGPDGVQVFGCRNMLLFGPPGTGKTLLAAATSNQLEAAFFNVKTSGVLSKYFGESTKLVASLYDVARERAPSVLFFDEFDALGSHRDASGSAGAERRLLASILAELDGMGEKDDPSLVFTLAATNLPWAIDTAVLSRFDRRVYVPLPGPKERGRIIELQTCSKGYELEASLDRLVMATGGLSGRRIKQCCEAAVQAMIVEANPSLANHVDKGRSALQGYRIQLKPLSWKHFEAAIERVSPDVTPDQIERYRQWQETNA